MRAIVLGLLAGASLFAIVGEASAVVKQRANHDAVAGHCGVYMYWQQGRCIDATDRGNAMTWPQWIMKYGTWKQ